MSVWSAALTLFLVLDPIGNLPVLLAMLKDVPPARRRWVILRESLFALAALMVFLFAGPTLLMLLGVEGPALKVAGGVVIFLIALRMIFPRPGGMFGDEVEPGEPFMVPLAIPLLAGPSAMAAVMLLSDAPRAGLGMSLLSLTTAWAACTLILLAGPTVAKILGRRGIIASERLMGMVLTVIAVQMMLSGVETYIVH